MQPVFLKAYKELSMTRQWIHLCAVIRHISNVDLLNT